MFIVLIRKLIWLIPVALGVVTVTFVAARILPVDPTVLYLPPDASPEIRDAMRAKLGLDQPIIVQFGVFLQHLAVGNLGVSFVTGRSVSEDLSDRLPVTAELGLIALLIAVIVGIPLGVLAAVYRDRTPDYVVRLLNLGGLSIPQFWLGLVLLWIFAVVLGWLPGPQGQLPVSAVVPPRVTGFLLVDSLLAGETDTFVAALRQLVLPVSVLAFSSAAPIMRMTRSAMIDALNSDYIRTAVAMGHRGLIIPFKYALRNALLPTLTTLGGVVSFVFSGVILVESIFAWPGIGAYALQAIEMSDFTGLQGFVIYAALLNTFIFVIVDILYILVDPRVRS